MHTRDHSPHLYGPHECDLDVLTERLVRYADAAYEAVRALNHATLAGSSPLPAPAVYALVGSLKRLGYALDQGVGQLAARLVDSANHYDLYEDDGSDPVESIARARAVLNEAAAHATAVGAGLDHAQSIVARQGYEPRSRDLDWDGGIV